MIDERVAPILKQYAQAEVRWWIHSEFLRRDYGKRFTVSSNGIIEHYGALEEYFISQARFSEEDLDRLIHSAISTHLNCICRPIETLCAFVYRNEESKSLHEINIRFSALTIRKDAQQEFLSLIQEMDTRASIEIQLSLQDFKDFLERACKSLIAHSNAQGLAEMLDPLFDILQACHGKETIPSEIPLIFFEDAKDNHWISFCKQELESGQTLEFNREQLLAFFAKNIVHEFPKTTQPLEKSKGTVYFADKEIILLSRPRNKGITNSPKPTLQKETIHIQDSQISKESINKEIHSLLDSFQHSAMPDDQPLRLTKRSFLGSIPIEVQMHYANALFNGNLGLLRRLGIAIDKTAGIDAGISTCKAYVSQYGASNREKEDVALGLFDLVHTFCTGREA